MLRSFAFASGLLVMLALAGPAAAQSKIFQQTQTFDTAAGPVKITPVYHAGALIQAGGKEIYIDPVKPGDFTGLPKADLILVTHDHNDHMDPAVIADLSTPKTAVIGPAAVAAKVTNTMPIVNGETKTWQAWTIEAVPAYNIVRGPAPGKQYHPKGVGNGYILTYGGKRFYFSGDTENLPELQTLKDIDVAFVCMRLPFTMTVDEAIALTKAIHPKVAIPYHYTGTDIAPFKAGLADTGIDVRLLDWYANTVPNKPSP